MFSDLFHVETQLLIFTLINSKILLMNLLLGLKPLIFAPSFYKVLFILNVYETDIIRLSMFVLDHSYCYAMSRPANWPKRFHVML